MKDDFCICDDCRFSDIQIYGIFCLKAEEYVNPKRKCKNHIQE